MEGLRSDAPLSLLSSPPFAWTHRRSIHLAMTRNASPVNRSVECLERRVLWLFGSERATAMARGFASRCVLIHNAVEVRNLGEGDPSRGRVLHPEHAAEVDHARSKLAPPAPITDRPSSAPIRP